MATFGEIIADEIEGSSFYLDNFSTGEVNLSDPLFNDLIERIRDKIFQNDSPKPIVPFDLEDTVQSGTVALLRQLVATEMIDLADDKAHGRLVVYGLCEPEDGEDDTDDPDPYDPDNPGDPF